MEEEENKVAVFPAEMSAIWLRGNMLNRWIKQEQRRWHGRRLTTVSVGGIRVMSACQCTN